MAICGGKTGYTSDILNMSIWVLNELAKPNLTQHPVCKIIQKHAI